MREQRWSKEETLNPSDIFTNFVYEIVETPISPPLSKHFHSLFLLGIQGRLMDNHTHSTRKLIQAELGLLVFNFNAVFHFDSSSTWHGIAMLQIEYNKIANQPIRIWWWYNIY